MRQTRLYFKARRPADLRALRHGRAGVNETLFKQFVFLLGAERVRRTRRRCHLYDLHQESAKVGRELTREYYLRYADMRQDAFELLSQGTPPSPAAGAVRRSEASRPRPSSSPSPKTAACSRPRRSRGLRAPRPLPTPDRVGQLRALFRSIDHGNAALGIHAYNGGPSPPTPSSTPERDRRSLRPPPRLALLRLPPPYRRSTATPTGATPASSTSKSSATFRASITDLEKLRSEAEGLAEPAVAGEGAQYPRNKEGAF